jgi:hypothetical protein
MHDVQERIAAALERIAEALEKRNRDDVTANSGGTGNGPPR